MYYQELDLDITSPWRYPKTTVEYNYKLYGDLFYQWIEEYTNTANPIIFDQNKKQIEIEFNIDKSRFFFYRLAKIIYLYNEWNTHGKWRDPIVVRPMLQRNNQTLYIVGPGQDRWLVMKHFNVKTYNFLIVDPAEYIPENEETIVAHWKNSSLKFKRASDDKWTLLNTTRRFNFVDVLTDWFSYNSRGLGSIAEPNLVPARQRALDRHKKGPG